MHDLYCWLSTQTEMARKARYVLATFCQTLGIGLKTVDRNADIPTDCCLLSYGPPPVANTERLLLIEPSAEAAAYYAARRPYNPAGLYVWYSPEGDLPLLFPPHQAHLNRPGLLPDILASAFFFLSRWEESVIETRDQWGRYRYEDSVYPHLGGLYPPIVDRYLAAFRHELEKAGMELPTCPLWPDGRAFAVGLTHDVDHLTKWRWAEVRAAGGRFLRNLPQHPTDALSRLARDACSLLARENPYWNLEEILSQESARGMRSTFFILPSHQHQHDADYDLEDGQVRAVLRQLAAQGAEIGLHVGFSAYGDEEETVQQLKALNQELDAQVRGVRQHFLRLDTQQTLARYERLGLKYDSTLGFAETPGYRAGFSFPFSPYSVDEDRPLDLLELPLTIMDVSLGPKYQNLSAQGAWHSIEKWLSYTAKRGGCCILLWHNSYWDELDFPGYGDLYLRILDWVAEHDGWGTSCGEIWRWWTERTQI
jgi:hypothetical protein